MSLSSFSLEEQKQVLASRCWIFTWEAHERREALIRVKWQGNNNIFESVKWGQKESQIFIHSTKFFLSMCKHPWMTKCSHAPFWQSCEIIHSESNLASYITSYYMSRSYSCIKLIIWLSINNNLHFATAHFPGMHDLKTSGNEEFITLTVCSSG